MITWYALGLFITAFLHMSYTYYAAWRQKTFVNWINCGPMLVLFVIWPYYWLLFIVGNYKAYKHSQMLKYMDKEPK